MIPVQPQEKPEDFDERVKEKGHAWLREHGIGLDAIPFDPSKLPPLWRQYNHYLWTVYKGVCAYLAFYFEFASGAATTDHFIAKSQHAGKAYEWENYRLSCLGANRQKNNFDDLLDPFEIPANTFFLVLESGEIYVNPALDTLNPELVKLAERTKERLQLNHPHNCAMRADHYGWYIALKNDLKSTDSLQRCLEKQNPFVYSEIKRQRKL
jgi:hypothetical protein